MVLGPLEAKSLAAGTITREMLSQDVLDEIFGALATSVGGSNGDYKEGTGSFTTSGGTVTLGTSSDKFDHGTADVDVEFIVDHFFYATTNYTTAQAQATLNFEVSADGTFTDLTSATKTHTLQFLEYDLSSYYGYTYLVYYLTGDVTKTFTSGSGNDIPDDTDLQFRVRVTGVGTAFTNQTVPFTLEANEGVTGVVSTGGNADTLDNLDSTAFLRSNTNDTFDGDLTITGQLILQGSIDQYNVTDLDVTDKTITVNSGNTQSLSDGAGLIVDRGTAADASITWNETSDKFDFTHPIYASTFISGQGSASSPAIQVGDNDSGFYDSGANQVGVTLGGVLEYDFQPTQLDLQSNNLVTTGVVITGHGSAASPAIGVGDNNSGFYDSGANEIGVTLDGVLEYEFTPTQFNMAANNLVTSGTLSSGAITSSGNVTATGLVASSSATAATLFSIGSSSQGSYTLAEWKTSAHGTTEAYIIAYGAGHSSQAGNFAIKNLEASSDIFFELASNVEPLRLSSTGATFAGTISSGAITASGAVRAPSIKHDNTNDTVIDLNDNTYTIINNPDGTESIKIGGGSSTDAQNTYKNDIHRFYKADGSTDLGRLYQGVADFFSNTIYGGSIDVSGNSDANAFRINGTTVITSARALSNVTANASIITSGTIANARMPNYINSSDTRNTNTTPSGRDRGLYADFKTQSVIGLTAGGTYAGLLTFRSYGTSTDLSGGNPLQIAYGEDTTNDRPELYMRIGSSSSAWGDWQRIFADDYHPNADKWTTARTLTLTGDVTGSVSWDGSSNVTMTTTGGGGAVDSVTNFVE